MPSVSGLSSLGTFACLVQVQYCICQAACHFVFAHHGQFGGAVSGNQCDYVGVDAKAGAGYFEVVCYDHIQVFALQLCSGMFQHMFCLHGKAADHLLRSAVGP